MSRKEDNKLFKLTDKITLKLYSQPDEENIQRAMNEILNIWGFRKTINKVSCSYGMKHALEHYRRTHPNYTDEDGKELNCYICNNDFIIAMHRLGFKVQRCSTDADDPNFYFNRSKMNKYVEKELNSRNRYYS
jgi:hypothetical protein